MTTMMDQHPRIPRKTSDLCGVKVLVLAAHPDDESFACGGAIALHRQRHDPVKVVVISDGGRWLWDDGTAPADYAARRRGEVKRACAVLGVDDLELWDLPDGELAEAGLDERIAELLANERPELVYAPSPDDCHDDHRAVAAALWRAVPAAGIPLRIAFHDFSLPLAVNTLVDISAVVEIKRQACDCYRSQLEHLNYTEIALALNRYRSLTVAATSEWAEGYLVVDPAVYRPWASPSTRGGPAPVSSAGNHEDAPLVSVVVRTRDRPLLLGHALASLAAQTWRPLELIVVNDGGTDVTSVIAQAAADLDCQIIENVEARGRSAAGNQGVARARGCYVAFLDDDDLFHPSHLEHLVRDLQSAGPAVVYGDAEIGAYELAGDRIATVAEPRPFPTRDFDADWLQVRNYIPLDCALFPRELWDRAGGFDESLDALEDWDLWLRMAAHSPFRRVAGVSATIRVFGDHRHDFITATTRVYAKHREFWTPANLAERIWPRLQLLEERASSTAAGDHSPGLARMALRLLLRLTPLRLKHWLNLRLQAYRRW